MHDKAQLLSEKCRKCSPTPGQILSGLHLVCDWAHKSADRGFAPYSENHRIGLFDALLIKDNHIVSAGGIAPAIEAARELHSDKPIEIEIESIEELRDALSAKAERILLDNFSLQKLERAVDLSMRFEQ